jgi:coproporphyrinogen III oxidase
MKMETPVDAATWRQRDDQIARELIDLQRSIVDALTALDGGQRCFESDAWERAEGGGGTTCVLQGGNVFEKVGIGFSRVEGAALPATATANRPGVAGRAFVAMGVSLVAHPYSPKVPTAHMNVRFFRTVPEDSTESVWWFGGGYDLTPYYGYVADCVHWHCTAKAVCEKHYDAAFYGRLKEWCDSYFHIRHRKCARGVGGIFFDDLNEPDFDTAYAFTLDVGRSFMDAYGPIVSVRCNEPFTEQQKQFQLYRRGRYVEFNLVYDRGTLFGLQSGGRVESILMSMPPLVRFDYGWHNEPGTPEAELESEFLAPRDWVAHSSS